VVADGEDGLLFALVDIIPGVIPGAVDIIPGVIPGVVDIIPGVIVEIVDIAVGDTVDIAAAVAVEGDLESSLAWTRVKSKARSITISLSETGVLLFCGGLTASSTSST
jgi:hypothetical protein